MRPLINFMAVIESTPMFMKAIDCSGETKDKFFIANLIKEVINEVGANNVVQTITDNAPNCKAARQLIEAQFPQILWTPCVVHTLNLALKNICTSKNVERNEVTYEECSWISDIAGDTMMVKHFITNHSIRLAIYNEFVPLKLLSVAETPFASTIVMLRILKLIKHGFQAMVISDKWSCYREDDVGNAKFVKDKILDDLWWDFINYILSFMAPIYDMLRARDTDKPCLHLVYDMWDSMIENVKMAIYRHKRKRVEEVSTFYDVVHQILVDQWNKNNTPLHCLAHSLNPKYYSDEWLHEDPNRVPPHRDEEVTHERNKCFKRYLDEIMERTKVITEFGKFSGYFGPFSEYDSIHNRWHMDPYTWWCAYGTYAPTLQKIALRLLVQPASSFCCERNWSTYSFIHSVKRNKMTPQRAEDLVFIHTNLRLLSRRSSHYLQRETKMRDIAGDNFDSLDDVGMLGIANLSLDEPAMEAVLLTDDGEGDGEGVGNDEEVVEVPPS